MDQALKNILAKNSLYSYYNKKKLEPCVTRIDHQQCIKNYSDLCKLILMGDNKLIESNYYKELEKHVEDVGHGK